MSVESSEPVTGSDGRQAYVDLSEVARGSEAPFVALYADRGLTERVGWFCTNCGSDATSMDAMERVACESCENHSAPERTDASYL
ncbi:MAG: DUF5816 domain-containing protein [Halarchaeum sp.]